MTAPDPLPELTTPRLLLRGVVASDLPDLLSLYGDPEVSRWRAHALLRNEADARAYLDEVRRGAADGTLLEWAIALRGDHDRLIGTCTLAAIDRNAATAELGYGISPPHQRQGYAVEAADAVVRFGRESLGLRVVFAETDPGNDASEKVLLRLGFQRVGNRWELLMG